MQYFSTEIRVPRAGYAWVPAMGNPLGRLEPLDQDSKGGSDSQAFQTYDPFREKPTLYIEFTKIRGADAVLNLPRDKWKKSKEIALFRTDVVRFANSHGDPARSVPDYMLRKPIGRDIAKAVISMQLAFAVSEALKSRNREGISALVKPMGAGLWTVDHAGRRIAPVDQLWSEFLVLANTNDPIPKRPPGEHQLALAVLEYLLEQNLRTNLRFVDDGGHLKLRIEPDSLLSTMWAQLGLAISENKRYRNCEFCGRLFEIGESRAPGKRRSRSNKRFCSTNCRVKNSKRKQARLTTDFAGDGREE